MLIAHPTCSFRGIPLVAISLWATELDFRLRDYGFAVQRDDEMIVETENSTISTKATQIMHTLCDEVRAFQLH